MAFGFQILNTQSKIYLLTNSARMLFCTAYSRFSPSSAFCLTLYSLPFALLFRFDEKEALAYIDMHNVGDMIFIFYFLLSTRDLNFGIWNCTTNLRLLNGVAGTFLDAGLRFSEMHSRKSERKAQISSAADVVLQADE